MDKLKTEWRKYGLGISLFACALLGGGPAPGPWTDTILQVVIILTAAPVLALSRGPEIDQRALWLSGAVLAAVAIQLAPLPGFLPELFRDDLLSAGRDESGTSLSFISLGLGRTFEILVYAAVLVLFFLAMLRLSGPQLHALLPFFLAGVACNALTGLIQYSASDARLDGVLPYVMAGGFFANRNHFVSLLCTALPFLVYLATYAGTRLVALASVAVLLLVLLAAGSRAGALIGLAALVLSIGFFAVRSRASLATFIVVIALVGIQSLGTWSLIETRELTDLSRAQFALTTLKGIAANWLLGVGYGTFPVAYQMYESSSEIYRAYVNHAHNDWLELVFEGGLAALFALVAYLVLLGGQLLRVRHSHFHKAAFLGILFILVHSTVDYPLRTMAVASAFLFFNAILFHTEMQPRRGKERPTVSVREGRRVRRVPVQQQ